jgi:hypothetical protein
VLKAAKHTLDFRKNHNLDEEDICDKPPRKLTSGNVHEYWTKRCAGDAYITVHPDTKRGIIMFLTSSHSDPDAADKVTDEVWDDAFIYTSQYIHQWLD